MPKENQQLISTHVPDFVYVIVIELVNILWVNQYHPPPCIFIYDSSAREAGGGGGGAGERGEILGREVVYDEELAKSPALSRPAGSPISGELVERWRVHLQLLAAAAAAAAAAVAAAACW